MNQTKITPGEQFMKDVQNLFADYYRRQLSENIKRALRAKKMQKSKKS